MYPSLTMESSVLVTTRRSASRADVSTAVGCPASAAVDRFWQSLGKENQVPFGPDEMDDTAHQRVDDVLETLGRVDDDAAAHVGGQQVAQHVDGVATADGDRRLTVGRHRLAEDLEQQAAVADRQASQHRLRCGWWVSFPEGAVGSWLTCSEDRTA